MSSSTIETPEIRVLRMEVREAEKERRTVTGLAVPYNEATPIGGAYVEVMAPGCFRKSIQEAARGLPLMAIHSRDKWPVGKSVAWEETPSGLIGTWEFASTREADEAYSMVSDGFVTGLSVGFMPIQSDVNFDNDVPMVTRREARMLETSLVPSPQYASAQITLVRTAGVQRPKPPRLEEWKRRMSGLIAPTVD